MTQITERICRAFMNHRTLKIDNSETDGTSLWLFGNMVAQWRHGELCITNAGWKTKTTKERLNGLDGVRIQSIRGTWHLNGTAWDGGWIQVSNNYGNWSIDEPTDSEPVEEEIEFDTTCAWVPEKKCSVPVYSVIHSNDIADIDGAEFKLNLSDVPVRRMESDTQGEYKPNYFLVVRAQDYLIAKTILR